MDADTNTRQKILNCCKQEFLENGFKNASMRNIASAAGVTTGAIYGYFKDKNALFEALINPVCDRVEAMFSEVSKEYYSEDGSFSEMSTEKTIAEIRKVYDLVYKYFDEFRLLVCSSEGSSKADFIHTLVDLEVVHTMNYIDNMKRAGKMGAMISKSTIHILSDSFINAILEPVRHNMSYETALKDAELIGRFYTGGWHQMFNYISS